MARVKRSPPCVHGDRYCQQCYNREWFQKHPEYKRQWRQRNPDKVTAERQGARSRTAQWNKDNPEKAFVSRYKFSAKDRNIVWALSTDEAINIAANACTYCGQTPARGIDRSDNAVGYTTENSVPCCQWCNYAKRIHTVEHFIARCRAVVEHHG
jgi:hypothetical protein